MGKLKLASAALISATAAAAVVAVRGDARSRRDTLEACRQRVRNIERVSGIGEYVWNVDSGAVWCSRNGYRLFGWQPDSGADYGRVLSALHPEDASGAERTLRRLLAGRQPPEIEVRIVQPDGSVRHVLTTGEVCEEGGQRIVVGYMKDVTELAKVRRRLVRAEAQYRFLFEHNPIPMWVFDRNTLAFLAVNDAMLGHYGYTCAQLVGRTLPDIVAEGEREAVPAAMARSGRDWPQGEVWTHCHRDGTHLRMALHVHDIEFAGRPARLVAAQDVTERERNEARFRLIASAASDAVYDFDLRSGHVWWSDSFYARFGHAPGSVELSMEGWEALLHPDDAGPVLDSLEAALASDASEWTADYRLRCADGRYALVTERGLMARDDGGRPVRMVGGLIDMTETRQHEADLRLLRRAVESAENGIVVTRAGERDQAVVYVNPAFEKITGYTAAEIQGRDCRVLQQDDREQPGLDAIRYALHDGHDVRALLRNYRKDGTLFWNQMYISPVRNDAGALTHFVGVLNDVSEHHHYEERLAHRATHDELTDLPNRVLLEDRLHQAIRLSDRESTRTTVVFIDLDDFKLVNDSLGHSAGDTLLCEVARRLRAVVRETDTVCRFGGDEFVAVLTSPSQQEHPAEIIQRIVDALAPPMPLGDTQHTLTASIGYCAYPRDGHDPETLLRRADLAMYEAKQQGRNRVVAYRRELDTGINKRLKLLHQLREALEKSQFELVFQPQVAADGTVRALEALVRWNHPTRGELLPGEFIAACEASGLIVELGRRVLRGAVQYHAQLVQAGLAGVRIAVNVSAAQFNDDLYSEVEAAVRGHRLPPGTLELELTESVLMASPAYAVELMERLAELGVGFSVDDFGTGYSSLAYLKRFPIARLKIDRSFVQDLGHDPNDSAICQSIISLAHALEIGAVAEGVETEEQCAWLRERGCDELQGYLLGRPAPFATLLPQLRASPHA